MFDEIVTKNGIKFKELEKKIFKFVCFLGCVLIKMLLENYDKKLMKARDNNKYRHKGYRKNTIKTVMGEIEYTRAMYLVKEEEKSKYVFLLDELMQISSIGKVSMNLAELVLNIVPETKSYRKASENIQIATNEILSHEAIREIVLIAGEKQSKKEKEEVSLMKQEKLVKGLKQITALFEEADGLWISLQGKDRENMQEKYRKECEKNGKEFNVNRKVKTELKLHMTYEGWKKGDERHSLVNKRYIAGMMKPREIKELRDARVYQMYDTEKIELRVLNGDGAKWINNIKAEGTISQKDNFHIRQEIVRDVPKEYRNILEELLNKKEYSKIPDAIEGLKYELGGEEKAIQKLDVLKSYLKVRMNRYQDVLKSQGKEMPKAAGGIEYRNPGTMESQIFTVLKVRLTSGRKSFSIIGADALAKVCAMKVENEGKIELEELERTIPVDNTVEEWIRQIEENVTKNKHHRVNTREKQDSRNATKNIIIKPKFMKEILRLKEFSEMRCSF